MFNLSFFQLEWLAEDESVPFASLLADELILVSWLMVLDLFGDEHSHRAVNVQVIGAFSGLHLCRRVNIIDYSR